MPTRDNAPGKFMQRSMMGVGLALAMFVGLYLCGSPQHRALKTECIKAGMDHSDAPSDDDLHRLWMACRKIGFGPPL